MGLRPRESGRVPAPILDGCRYVEPAKAGGGGEPVAPAPRLVSRPRPEKGPGGFVLKGQVAQLVEHVTENHGVGGSIPSLAISLGLRRVEGRCL